MSNRTSKSNKAITQAWEKEKQIVSEGKGTRDWTTDQQKDILERGKAYDENGKAFEGQHMRSAEMYPECQSDPDNIQFLTREEHRAAHDGDWRNPTNWYYNPVTKEKIDFGDGPIVPCNVIKLTKPIYISIDKDTAVSASEEAIFIDKEKAAKVPLETETSREKNKQTHKTKPKASTISPSTKPKHGRGFWGWAKKVGQKVGHSLRANKGKILFGVLIGSARLAKAIYDSKSNGAGNSGDPDSGLSSCRSDYSLNLDDDFGSLSDDNNFSVDERDYPDERQSPREHDVSGYTRYFNGKEIHVSPYKRGGKKDE